MHEGRRSRFDLERVLRPRSVAFVGISEESGFADSARRSLEASDTDFYFVHPRAQSVFGHQTFPDLASIDLPVDAVFSCVSAERTVDVVSEAAAVGAGGVIAVAGGFAEMGEHGELLQQAMAKHARGADLPVIGPNGVGMINAHKGLDLCILVDFPRRSGGLSVAMHSGAMIEALAASAWRAGGVGLNVLVSAGNEAVTDLADYLDYFAEDDSTTVVGLVVERIRRPDAFFDAAARCLQAGKPIVALKLGKSERSQRMASSHTGTLTGDTWVYDVAFRQAGILMATDIDDMVDRVQFLEQLPRHKWTPVRGLAVLTGTGGFAQLASDLAEVEKIHIPEAPRLVPFVGANIPGCTVPNPLDVTGFVNGSDDRWERIVREFASAPEFDTLLFTSQHADWDEGERMSAPYVDTASQSDKAFVIGPLAGVGGSWLERYRADGVAIGNGLRGSLHGISTMGQFMRLRPTSRVSPASDVPAVPLPEGVVAGEPPMLSFSRTMELLRGWGVATAPYVVIPPGVRPEPPAFDGPYVAKLADVAHRSDHNAVVLDVSGAELAAAVNGLRELASEHGLPADVAVQPMLRGYGEAFIGIQGDTELGPVVAFGLGGVLVEVLGRVGGRMAPMTGEDAVELIAEFDDLRVLDGYRGLPAWDKTMLARTLVSVSRLAAAGRKWIDTFDINPLIITEGGPVAVDGLCLLR